MQSTKEANNLCNIHSYKYFGLAKKMTVTIQPAPEMESIVPLWTTKTEKQNAPAKLNHCW
jgi:large subunit ribosomal protein L28e